MTITDLQQRITELGCAISIRMAQGVYIVQAYSCTDVYIVRESLDLETAIVEALDAYEELTRPRTEGPLDPFAPRRHRVAVAAGGSEFEEQR